MVKHSQKRLSIALCLVLRTIGANASHQWCGASTPHVRSINKMNGDEE